MKKQRILVTLLTSLLVSVAIYQLNILKTTVSAEPITSPPISSPPVTSPEVAVTPTITQNQNKSGSNGSTASSSASTSTNLSCSVAKPHNKPVLFQINTTRDSAALYFTPVGEADSYSVIYSKSLREEQYGAVFQAGSNQGVQKIIINNLTKNTQYYFKISANDDCASSEWSTYLGARTTFKGTAVHYLFTKKVNKSVKGVSTKSQSTKNIKIKNTNQKVQYEGWEMI